MLHTTLKKFNHPETLVKEYDNWWLLCRLKQVTLGSLVLICKDEVEAFSKISAESFSEFPKIIKELELKLKKEFGYDKINYMMLMMADPEVHFHIFPRYSIDRNFENTCFRDAGWPDLPDTKNPNNVGKDIFVALIHRLKSVFNNS